MLFFTCVFNSKQENIIFVYIITIIIIIIIVIIIIITFYLSSSFGTILSVFFLYSVYQKRIRLQINEALSGGRGVCQSVCVLRWQSLPCLLRQFQPIFMSFVTISCVFQGHVTCWNFTL